ncbi:hypothetical protein CRYUN_Cryun30bG0077600 [Craigia yunnanensis]
MVVAFEQRTGRESVGYACSMDCHYASYASFSPSPLKDFGAKNRKFRPFQLQVSSIGNSARTSYNTLVSELKGWYNKDDVVAEWKKVKETMFLNVHCYVSGPNLLLDLAAEFRYHIFSKELPLVLKAVLHGDSVLFAEHPELMDALVCVYFHSSLPKYNRMECWGAIKDAAEGKLGDQVQGLLTADKESSSPPAKWGRSPKSIFQALFTFLL